MRVKDPIVEEVRAVRDALAKEYDYDVEKLGRAMQAAEKAEGRKTVILQPRRPKSDKKAS